MKYGLDTRRPLPEKIRKIIPLFLVVNKNHERIRFPSVSIEQIRTTR
ncbi:MAG TPA: hypothetical protein P5013_03430 [Methanoregula sp.]|nr:hypothetical protein [Methanoregula sp.]